jgi:hypothetical protein
MKKIALFLLAPMFAVLSASAQDVKLKTDGQDPAYVETIKGRSQKIVDKLGIADKQQAENVLNIVCNRYFLLNDIHQACEKAVKEAKEKLQGDERNAAVKAAENARDAELYKHHFELVSALALYLTDEQIDAVKDGMTYGRLKRDYQAQLDMIPTLTDFEKQQVLAWLKEAREYAMDAADSKGKHFWFDKYRGRTNNWLSARGYDLKKERDNWMKRIEEQKVKQP